MSDEKTSFVLKHPRDEINVVIGRCTSVVGNSRKLEFVVPIASN
jgi:hypothetical protein